VLGMLHPMSRSSHSMVSGSNQPAGNDLRDVDDTYNVIGRARSATDAFQITDAAITELTATANDGDEPDISTAELAQGNPIPTDHTPF